MSEWTITSVMGYAAWVIERVAPRERGYIDRVMNTQGLWKLMEDTYARVLVSL
jgi:hypothetical protein